ncbi:hypothetical protein SDC9_210882 [bioreactor metagenome]|uniref:Uncharacterized protein n=1 Tax=bioreactor metagenome TaxID=1076179 RepID=A0A645JHF9_9ZZZZ
MAAAVALASPPRVAPHGVGSIGKTIDGRPGQAGHGKPEQRSNHGVAEVLGQGLDGAFSHGGRVQLSRVAAHQPAQALPPCGQRLLQCGLHGQHLILEHAPGQ